MSTLRNKLIRLAHEKPELRGHLLPLLKEAGSYQDYRSKSKARPPLTKEQWEKKQEKLRGMSHAELQKHHDEHQQKANAYSPQEMAFDQAAAHTHLHHSDHQMITKDHMDTRGKVAVTTRENYNAYLKKTKAMSPLKFDAWKQHHERLQNQSDSSLRNSLKRHQKESEKHYDNHGKSEGRAKAVAKRDGDRQHDKAQLVQQHIDYRTQVRSDLNKVKVKVK